MTKPTIGQDPWGEQLNAHLDSIETKADNAAAVATTAQSTADGKADAVHTHAQSDVTGLATTLSGKADTTHSHSQSDVTGLTTALSGKANTSHSHATADVTGLDTALAGKAASSHSHAQADVTGLDTALAGKSDTGHTHTASNVSDFSEAVDDRVNALLVAGTNITKSYDDIAGTLTLSASGGGGGGGSFPAVKPATNEYIASTFCNGNGTDSGTNLGDMVAVPIYIKGSMTTAQLAITINTATASAVHRLGIYNTASDGRPGTLLVDAGTVSSSTTGVKTLALSQALSEGLYWLVAVPQVALARYRGYTSHHAYPIAGDNLVIQTPGQNVWRVTGVTGALPSSPTWAFAGNVGGNIVPIIGIVGA